MWLVLKLFIFIIIVYSLNKIHSFIHTDFDLIIWKHIINIKGKQILIDSQE